MSIVLQLDTDFKEALKSKQEARLSILRLVRSAVKNIEIEKHGPASDEDAIAVLQREIKQHKESIEAFEKAGREAEVTRLRTEMELLEKYLPPKLSDDELKDAIDNAIAESGATSVADMGKVMGAVMPKVKGRATGDEVGAMVRTILQGS